MEATEEGTLQQTLEWLAEIFEEPPEKIRPETSRDQVPAWDSLGMLTLMAGLNQKFDVVMTEQELTGMKKVDDILEVLRRSGKLP